MLFKVIKYTKTLDGESREEVTSFVEREQAEEFAKAQNARQEGQEVQAGYKFEESSAPAKPTVYFIPAAKSVSVKVRTTIRDLIIQAIGENNGRAFLSQIYPVVKKVRPKTIDQAVRGQLYRDRDKDLFVQNSDGSYSLGVKAPVEAKAPSISTSGAIIAGKLFRPYIFSGPKGEAQLENAVIQNYRQVFGEGTLYLPIKKLIGSKLRKVTDGLLLDFNDKNHPSFWIVEAELSTHDLESHIQTQMMGFLRALEDEKTLRMLLKTVREFLLFSKKVTDAWASVYYHHPGKLWKRGEQTEYEYLDNLLHEQCGILIIIDEVTPDLEDIVRFLSKWGTVKVVEFKTFNADGEFVHYFSHVADLKKR